MATFYPYKCERCDFTIETEPQGYYSLRAGVFYNFKCKRCNEIVDIPLETLNTFDFECPNCKADESYLYTWNPIEGKCPHCGGCIVFDPDGPISKAD